MADMLMILALGAVGAVFGYWFRDQSGKRKGQELAAYITYLEEKLGLPHRYPAQQAPAFQSFPGQTPIQPPAQNAQQSEIEALKNEIEKLKKEKQ